MSLIVVDVEADGPIPGIYSMVCFGAVLLQPNLLEAPTFYGETFPISDKYIKEALAVSGFTREDHLTFSNPTPVMMGFNEWVLSNSIGRPEFISDNPAFDWQFINYYFHTTIGLNPFGHAARRIGDLYCGMEGDIRLNREWKKRFRKTKHTHNPVDDAMGNAEALLMMKKMGLKGY